MSHLPALMMMISHHSQAQQRRHGWQLTQPAAVVDELNRFSHITRPIAPGVVAGAKGRRVLV